MWENDNELFQLMRDELFTAVVGDVLDVMGLTHQFLSPNFKPLRDDMVIVGRAMPVLNADYFAPINDGQTDLSDKPFGLTFRALDDLKANEVYVATGGSRRYAMWGELMSTRAIQLKANGAILDGYSRDTNGILRLNYPTFSHGRYAQDAGARSKVVDFRIAIEVDGVPIRNGDIIFADLDGVLVIPTEAEEEAMTKALEKARTENKVRTAIENGMSTVEAFQQFGVM